MLKYPSINYTSTLDRKRFTGKSDTGKQGKQSIDKMQVKAITEDPIWRILNSDTFTNALESQGHSSVDCRYMVILKSFLLYWLHTKYLDQSTEKIDTEQILRNFVKTY